jgi:hypothetical protein
MWRRRNPEDNPRFRRNIKRSSSLSILTEDLESRSSNASNESFERSTNSKDIPLSIPDSDSDTNLD